MNVIQERTPSDVQGACSSLGDWETSTERECPTRHLTQSTETSLSRPAPTTRLGSIWIRQLQTNSTTTTSAISKATVDFCRATRCFSPLPALPPSPLWTASPPAQTRSPMALEPPWSRWGTSALWPGLMARFASLALELILCLLLLICKFYSPTVLCFLLDFLMK